MTRKQNENEKSDSLEFLRIQMPGYVLYDLKPVFEFWSTAFDVSNGVVVFARIMTPGFIERIKYFGAAIARHIKVMPMLRK